MVKKTIDSFLKKRGAIVTTELSTQNVGTSISSENEPRPPKVPRVELHETPIIEPQQTPIIEFQETPTMEPQEIPIVEPREIPRVETQEIDTSSLERDPGLRQDIWSYPPSKREDIRRAYLKFGPYQPMPTKNKPFPRDKNR
ncbi:hypothetical protein FRX31_005681, partial [Thalictrum thalictroides]